MKPVINLEESIGKTVGRRNVSTDSLDFGLRLQETMAQMYGRFPIRKGVYRFRSHEDADEWMMRFLALKKAN